IYAGVRTNVGANQFVQVPVFMKTAPGVAVSGMQFVADVMPVNGAPPVSGTSFYPSSVINQPTRLGSELPDKTLMPSTVYARWDNIAPSLKGDVPIGWVQFVTPSTVQAAHHYTILLHDTGGAAIDPNTGTLTPYLFQSIHGE